MKNPIKAIIKKIRIRGLTGGKWRDHDDHFWLIVRWETGDNEGLHSILTRYSQRKQKEKFTVMNSFPRGTAGYNQAKRAINTQYYGG